MKLSIVVPTLGRDFSRCLQSLLHQSLSTGDYEILLVINGNGAPDIARDSVRVLREPKPGVNYARNTGWKNAEADIIAFTDDDVVVDGQWAERILRTFELYPEVSCLGGKIDPHWLAPPPHWLTDEMKSDLSLLDLSKEPIYVPTSQIVYSANMALRKSVLVEFGGFTTEVQRTGSGLMSNCEIGLQRKLHEKKYPILYSPDIKVFHLIDKNRLTKKYFLRRNFW